MYGGAMVPQWQQSMMGTTPGNYFGDAYQMDMAKQSDEGIPWKEAAKYTDIIWAKSADNNNGSYTNNQLTLQTGDVNSFVVWKYAYVAIPVTVVATVVTPDMLNPVVLGGATVNGGGVNGSTYPRPTPSPYSVGWKSGAWQIVDSMILTFCGKTINNQSRFSNALAHFRALTETSPDALKVIAKSWQFFPDSFDSAKLVLTNNGTNASNTVCAVGGYSNNAVVPDSVLQAGSNMLCATGNSATAGVPPVPGGVDGKVAATDVVVLTNAQWSGYPCLLQCPFTTGPVTSADFFVLLPTQLGGTPNATQTGTTPPTVIGSTQLLLSANAVIDVTVLQNVVTATYPGLTVGIIIGNITGADFTPGGNGTSILPNNAFQVRLTMAADGTNRPFKLIFKIWEPTLYNPALAPGANVNPLNNGVNMGLIERCRYWAYQTPIGCSIAAEPSLVQEFRDSATAGLGGAGGGVVGPVTGSIATIGTAVTTSIQLYRAVIKLPLMFLHDIFDQLDYPMAGTNWNITLILNQVSSSVLNPSRAFLAAAATTGVPASYSTFGNCSSTQFLSGGLTCPVIVSNVGAAQNLATTGSLAAPQIVPTYGQFSGGIQSVSVFVGNAPNSGTVPLGPGAFLNQCFLYYPVVGLPFNPLSRMAAEVGMSVYEKKVHYLDHMWIQSPNVYVPQQNAQWFITSDVVGLQYLLILPFIDVSAMGSGEGVAPYSSCTTSEPGTMSPQASLTNFSIMVDDFNYYVNPLNYTYETWLHALRQFLPNDGQDTIISGGLIDQQAWENGYRVYAFDLSRAPVSKRAGKLFFNFTNNSPYTIQLHALPIAAKRLAITYSPGAKGPSVSVFQGDY